MAHKRLFLAIVAIALSVLAVQARAADLTVFAAASLQESLSEAADAYAAAGHARPVLSFAGSSALARQIEAGAPANLFISADEQWMDYLAQRGLIAADTRTSFLGNRLVLIAPARRPFQAIIKFEFPLADILGNGKLALADPESVPAGRYGKAALTNLGVWPSVEGKVVRADNVRSALAFVERDEARAGIVYATDAAASKKVVVVDTFPEISHQKISYPLAVLKDRDTPDARALRGFLLSPAGAAIFAKYGFVTE